MIVTCERCATQFQLDELKVPAAGVRVRCSRCEHTFHVVSPAATAADQAEALVRDVLGTKSDAAKPGRVAESDEPDWGFNDDREIGGLNDDAELLAAREAVDDLLGSAPDPLDIADDDAADLELELDDDPSDEADDAPQQAIADEAEASPFGDSFDDSLETDSSADPDPEIDAVFDVPAAAAPETEADSEPAESAGDFEDPSSWDLFDAAASREAPLPRLPTRPTDDPSVSAAPRIAEPRLDTDSASQAGRVAHAIREVAGWSATLALVATCLWGGLSNPGAAGRAPMVGSAAGFDFRNVEGRWVDNAAEGPLYVVSGQIKHATGSSPWSVKPVEIQLRDARGAAVGLPRSALVGPEIPEAYLHESPAADLLEMQWQRAPQFSAFAGTWLRFDAVIPELPAAAERFDFARAEIDAGS